MKLHLPKQLFTALLAAITLAAPAALTLGSAAWGLSVTYEKSFSTTGGTGTATFTSEDGAMTYDYSTGTLTLAGGTTNSTTIDFSMLYTWEESSDVVFLKNTAGNVSGLVAKTDGTIKGKAANNNDYGTAKDKSLLLEAYEKSGNNDNTIRVTSTIKSSSGVTLTACDISEELYSASDLKYSGATWSSLVFDSSIVTKVYYSVAEGTEGANTVITSSDAKWKKSYATVVQVNKADTKADATVLNEGALKVEYNSDALSNLGNDIIVGGSGQLHLQTWGGNNNARNRDINISDKKLYLDSSTQSNGALRLGVYCGDITLGDIHLIGDTKITKESSNAESQVIFAGDVYGNYALTLAPDRSTDKFDGVVFTGNVDVKALNIAAGSEILFSGTVGRANKTNAQFTINGGSVEFQNTSYIGSIATSGGANLTFSGEKVVHTVLGNLQTDGSMGALTINAGTTLNVNGSLSNTWGMSGGIVVNGALYAGVLTLSSNSADNVSGSGVVDVDSFTAGNGGKTYSISVDTFKVGKDGISLHPSWGTTLNLSSAVTTVEGGISVKNGSSEGAGVLNFNNGSATVAGVVTNAGTINVNSGSVEMQKGLSGTGALHLVGGSLTLNGERNSIGSFSYTDGEFNYTTLTAGSATINGESTLSNSGHLTVTGTLAGSIENQAAGKVTLASDMSITADTNVSITGAGITEFGGTLTNNGTLTLGGVISLSGDINQHYEEREAAGETALYATDRFNTAVTNTDGNGFKLTSGGSYWLVQGGTTYLLEGISSREGYTITQVTDANKAEGERVGDVYISSKYNAGREFYVSTGSVQVNADEQAATSYTLQGGSMIITDGSVSASAITCDSDAYTNDTKKGIITVGAGAELLLDTMPGGVSLLNLLKGEGMVNAESAGRLVVTTEQNLGASPVTTYKGKLEIVGAKLSIGSDQANTNDLSSLSEIILNDGGNIFYKGKDDGDTSEMDFQKITVESGTGEFHLEDSGATKGAADTIQFGEIAVAAGATMQLTSRWQDSTYYVDKLTGAGEFHAKSATTSGLNKKLTVNNLDGFSGDLVFTNAGAGFEQVTVNTGSSQVNFHSLSVNDVQGFSFNVQADTTIGLLSATSGTVNVSADKTLTLGGGTADTQKQHSIGTLSAASAGVTLGDHATLSLGGGTHSIGTLTSGNDSKINLAGAATLNRISSGNVELEGYGTYDFGDFDITGGNSSTSDTYNSAIRVTYGDGWFGTVKFGSGSTFEFQNLDLNAFANGGNSTIELAGVTGYLQKSTDDTKTYEANFKLTGNGFTINNGYGGSKYKFTGDFGGSGNLTANKDLTSGLEFIFAGDMSQWTGELKHQLDSQNKYIYDAAKDVADTSIGNKLTAEGSGTTNAMNVVVKTNRDVVMNGELRAMSDATMNVTKENAGNLSVKSVAVEGTGVVNVAGLRISATKTASATAETPASMTNGTLQYLQEEASFTIEDMTLVNTTITAATVDTRVNLKNVSGDATLKTGTFALQVSANAPDNVGMSYAVTGAPSLTLANATAGDTKLVIAADPTADVSGAYGTYTLTFNLNLDLDAGISIPATGNAWKELVGFEGWLGTMLENQGATYLPADEVEVAQVDAGTSTPTVSYSYTAGTGGNVGTLAIVITGLNVPEPASATLGLAALMMLCARRRRKA